MNKPTDVNKNSVLSNFIWRFLERSAAQVVSFVVSVILARLLAPEAYGTIALVTVITTILNVFVDSGLANALIQKKDADELDFSTVFYFNMLVCGVLYLGLYACSPLIAGFYEDSELVPLIRVLGLTLVISGLKNVQQAYVSKQMQFRMFFFASLGGTVASAVVGIAMAYLGYGVWALAAQQVINVGANTVILWFTTGWRPQFKFSSERLKGLFSYGWKLLCSAFLDTVYKNLRQLIIGKLYTSGDLAYYNKGDQMPNIIVTNVNTSIDSVLLPVMSIEQDDRPRVKAMTRRAMMTSTYIMAPMMMGLAFVAEPLVSILLTDKWLPCVPFLRVFCITYMFYPVHTANLNAIKAMGRSDLFLKLEILKKVVGMALLLSSMWFGVMAMAYSLLIGSVAAQIINAWPNKKLLDYSYPEQLRDILPGIVLAAAMGVCVYGIGMICPLPQFVTLVIQILCGIVLYVAGSKLFRLESYTYMKDLLKQYLHKKKEAK